MSKRKRTVIAVIMIELLLAGLWYYLQLEAATSANANADTSRVIGETMGGAMGLILGLSPLLYLMARRNDLKDAERRAQVE
ncbi:MAG: hypothetical protein ACXW2T_03390 [Allosphingosinicella sp.]